MNVKLISNAVRSFSLLIVLVTWSTGFIAEGAIYQKTDGSVIDPIFDIWSNFTPMMDTALSTMRT